MSQRPFSRSRDLQRLRDEGYCVMIQGGYLVMREVPYVTATREVRAGTLISSLEMADDVTQSLRTHGTHVVHFDGEFPCAADGTRLPGIAHGEGPFDLGGGLRARYSFSNKPLDGYTDYYQKMTTYAAILAGPAAVLKPGMDPRVFRTPEVEEESVFHYTETASARAGIGALSDLLRPETVAIIGTGGTGSYVLDLIAKTPVREIRLIDGDDFLQHNAFRAPGAPSLDELRQVRKKVDYLQSIYAKMRRGIVAHAVPIRADTLHLLDGVTSAFLCMDAGPAEELAVRKLEAIGARFVDVGMGLELAGGSLGGILRVTASTPARRAHVHEGRVSFAEAADDLYASNIQVADLNALNAALAVVKWKKLLGFYRDVEGEHHSTYTTDGNLLLNGDGP
jgi:hypothetical protein